MLDGVHIPVRSSHHGSFAILLLIAWVTVLCGCSSSPGTFGARLTSQGALLLDGPASRMNADDVGTTQAQQVPMIYAFALSAGQPLPPASDVGDQIAALQTQGIDWHAVTIAGEGYIDLQCNKFIAALNDLERSKKTTLTNLNAVQAATVGIMGLALAAQKTIGVVGIALGLAASLFDTTTGTVLYQLPASAVASVVQAQRQLLRGDEDPPSKDWQRINNEATAAARLNDYLQYCVPVTIEANIAKVLTNTRPGPDQSLESRTPGVASTSIPPQQTSSQPLGTSSSARPTSPVAPTVLRPELSIGNPLSAIERSISRSQGRQIQSALCLPPDQQTGDFGEATRDAIASWRSVKQSRPPSTPLTLGEVNNLLNLTACPATYRNPFERFNYPTPESIAALQRQLAGAPGGIAALATTGVFDDETRKTIATLQQNKKLPVTGAMTRELADAIAL